eukprot:6125653-Amphidinium_carterae.2
MSESLSLLMASLPMSCPHGLSQSHVVRFALSGRARLLSSTAVVKDHPCLLGPCYLHPTCTSSTERYVVVGYPFPPPQPVFRLGSEEALLLGDGASWKCEQCCDAHEVRQYEFSAADWDITTLQSWQLALPDIPAGHPFFFGPVTMRTPGALPYNHTSGLAASRHVGA